MFRFVEIAVCALLAKFHGSRLLNVSQINGACNDTRVSHFNRQWLCAPRDMLVDGQKQITCLESPTLICLFTIIIRPIIIIRLTPGPLQATLSKLLTYCVLRSIQPSTLSRTGNKYRSSYGYWMKA